MSKPYPMSNTDKHIAFLLGSGFSVPAGLPTAKMLWGKIKDCYYSQLKYEFESKSVMEKSVTDWWLFPFWKILKSYQNENKINYEDFYDRILKEKEGTVCVTCLRKFVSDNVNKYWKGGNKLSLKISLFDDWQRELVKNYGNIIDVCINKYQEIIYENLSHANKIDDYKNFVSIIKKLCSCGNYIDIFTLNHDLLVERLLQTYSINFDDGFDYESPKKIGKHAFYDANINSFNNGKVNIYKLHGSIDLYQYIEDNKSEICYAKVTNGDPYMMSQKTIFNLTPYFLTGTTAKIVEYEHNEYIQQRLSIFGNKLKIADELIAIGYSGNDGGINDIIYESYDNWDNAVIIAPDANNHLFVKDKQAKPINKGIESLSLNDLDIH